MSIWGDVGQTMSDCWDGNPRAIGEIAGVGMDAIGMVTDAAPDAGEASHAVNSMLGIDEKAETTGNTGNHVGTVVGGLLGSILGPMGMVEGAELGSAAGGWLAGLVGGDEPAAKAQPLMPAIPSGIGGGGGGGGMSAAPGTVPTPSTHGANLHEGYRNAPRAGTGGGAFGSSDTGWSRPDTNPIPLPGYVP